MNAEKSRLRIALVCNTAWAIYTYRRGLLRMLIERGEVVTHGAYFGVATGRLSARDEATGEFVQVAAADHARLFAPPRH